MASTTTTVKLAFSSFVPAEGVDADKSPIIFMHGITASKENWFDIPQTVANATKRKVYALDARNHGDSPWHDWLNFDCNVDDLLHFMDSMEIPRAILVGHSMGGIIGIKAALRKPDRIEKLVVEDMYVKCVPQEQCNTIVAYLNLANAALQKVAKGTDEETAKKFVVDYVHQKLPKELVPKVTKRNWTDIELKTTADGRYSFKFNTDAVAKILSNVGTSLKENKGVYKGPTSFIYGGLSPYLVGEEKEHIQKFFPNAEFVNFENATHRVHGDVVTEFTDALIKFLLKE